MGLPGHRRTSGDKRRNSANKALKEATFHACPKCKKPVRPHRVCAFCGTYKGKTFINVDKRVVRSNKKAKAK